MILSGDQIVTNLGGGLDISPFNPKQLNPNSYNLRLADKLLIYKDTLLDPKKKLETTEIKIPERGYILQPGVLYLGSTVEHTETHKFVPMIEGRSSWGRLGLYIHVTAGFGDVGFCGHWTLELSVVQPLFIYPNVEICQIFYHTIQGRYTPYHSDKYQYNMGAQPSMIWKELNDST